MRFIDDVFNYRPSPSKENTQKKVSPKPLEKRNDE